MTGNPIFDFIAICLIQAGGLFLAGLLLDCFKGEEARGIKGIAISTLICLVALPIAQVLGSFIPFGGLLTFAVVYFVFQLEDLLDLIIFGAVWGFFNFYLMAGMHQTMAG